MPKDKKSPKDIGDKSPKTKNTKKPIDTTHHGYGQLFKLEATDRDEEIPFMNDDK